MEQNVTFPISYFKHCTSLPLERLLFCQSLACPCCVYSTSSAYEYQASSYELKRGNHVHEASLTLSLYSGPGFCVEHVFLWAYLSLSFGWGGTKKEGAMAAEYVF